MRTRIKICGLTRVEDAEAAIDIGVDAIGVIFYPNSPRYMPLKAAKPIFRLAQPLVTTVAVVVNPSSQLIAKLCASRMIDRFQFHGDESPKACESHAWPYYKALRVSANSDLRKLSKKYKAACALLLDTYVKGQPGGTGSVFDWTLLEQVKFHQRLILAGGLSPENVYQAVLSVRPYAVDLNSGVEIRPGIKDAVKLKETIIAVQEADQHLNKTV